MQKIIYLLLDEKNLNADVDGLVLPVKDLSTRSIKEYSLTEINNIKSKTDKEIFLLCDRVLFENDYLKYKDYINEILKMDVKILFSDIAFFEMAKINGKLNNLIYYSPTLALNSSDINAWKELGLKNLIISKECEYEGYLDIVSNVKDMSLGMLAFGYPCIYNSRRKMLTSFKEVSSESKISSSMLIKEKTRSMKQHVYEDQYGTYIFGGEVFFPGKYLKNLASDLDYLLIDPIFLKDQLAVIPMVKEGLKGNEVNLIDEPVSTFTLFKELVNNYE